MATTRVVPQSSCLHPSCHAHQAHPVSRLASRLTGVPAAATPAATPRQPWYRKITKNMVIGLLILIVIGLAGSLNDDDHKIADLKAKASHSTTQPTQVAQTSQVDKLQYAITYCNQAVDKADGPQCVKDLLATQN